MASWRRAAGTPNRLPTTWVIRRLVRERLGTRRVLLLVRLVRWPLRALLRPLVLRFPRDDRLVAFGASSHRFADNAAYLYLHMSRSTALRCVWVTGSREVASDLRGRRLAAVYRWSCRGVWVALCAATYVFDTDRSDVNLWLSDGATAVNLWHGVGLKRIQRERVGSSEAAVYAAPEGSWRARLFADDRRRSDWVLSSSPLMTDKFSTALGVPRDRCLELGYPRNDHLVSGSAPPPSLVSEDVYRSLDGFSPVVGYFPTFRDDTVSVPLDAAELASLANVVAEAGGRLLFKAHASSMTSLPADAPLVVLPGDADLNAHLGLCDVVVTDYSSVAIDFLLLRRPMILFCPDLAHYEDSRGFTLDPLEHTPGRLAQTTEELHRLLRDTGSLRAPENVEELVDAFWADTGVPGSSERVSRFVQGLSCRHRPQHR